MNGCPAQKPRSDDEPNQERGPHLCGYLDGHGGKLHVCACGAKWPA